MILRDRFRRVTAYAILVSMTLVAVLAVSSWAERKRNANEEYAVYSAYLSEGILNDAHDWSVGGPIQVVVNDRTRAGGTSRHWPLNLLDRRIDFERLDRSTRASYLIRNLFPSRLESNFSLPCRAKVVLASQSKIDFLSYGSYEFQKEFPHNMGYVTLSGVGFNSAHTQGVFYIDHFCGLCGGGQYVLMEKVNGSWHVVDEHSTWSS